MLARARIGVFVGLAACSSHASLAPDTGPEPSPDAHADVGTTLQRDGGRPSGASDAGKADAVGDSLQRLPTCNWPAASLIKPEASSGCWSVARTIVKCGACVTSSDGECAIGPSDGGALEGESPCVRACDPDSYGVIDGTVACTASLPDGGTPAPPEYPPGCTRTIVDTDVSDDQFMCCPCL